MWIRRDKNRGRWRVDEGRRKVGEVGGDEKVWEGERLEKCKCEIKKKYILKIIIWKWKEKR